MFEKSLFERLETSGDGPASVAGVIDRSVLSESVLINVRQILNARQGCCETRIDFGMPDLNDISAEASETIPAIARAVRIQIETFEPRLENVQVRFIPDPDRPADFSFNVSALLKVGDDAEPIKFDTVLGDDRHMRVRS